MSSTVSAGAIWRATLGVFVARRGRAVFGREGFGEGCWATWVIICNFGFESLDLQY